ncbi:hypothetical protein [Candidatus Poriferisodalis sp.]|uniref:hypothetical protein n=1 Tax=Candidatus Poriferisodalis sp. TaxID=3101277 RepID=UPI003B023505
MAESSEADEWNIHFFQRADETADRSGAVPSQDFLDSLSINTRARFEAVLNAVAAAPPPNFSGGGYWHAMHGQMSGLYEVRIRADGQNHRLLCLLERRGDGLGGPSIVCLGGFSKRLRTGAHPREYRRIRSYRDEFSKDRCVAS